MHVHMPERGTLSNVDANLYIQQSQKLGLVQLAEQLCAYVQDIPLDIVFEDDHVMVVNKVHICLSLPLHDCHLHAV